MVSSHLSGVEYAGIDKHQLWVGQAVRAHPTLALCTGTKAEKCACTDILGLRCNFLGLSSSSRRYGLNSLKGFRGASEAGEEVGNAGRRSDKSIGSAGGATKDITGGALIGVGVLTGGHKSTGGGGGDDGKRALSGDPTAYGGGDEAVCGALRINAARREGSACNHF